MQLNPKNPAHKRLLDMEASICNAFMGMSETLGLSELYAELRPHQRERIVVFLKNMLQYDNDGE